jgi:hypothetical protein
MSLQTAPVNSIAPTLASQIASGWNPVCQIAYNRDTWVKLLQPPSEYAFDEAKLLCQDSLETWVAWVPDYGEVVLERGQFYC